MNTHRSNPVLLLQWAFAAKIECCLVRFDLLREGVGYKWVFGGDILVCFNGDDVFELDDLGWILVDPLILVCEEEVIGEDDPSSELLNEYLRQDLRNRDCFSQKPSFWIDWISLRISELSILFMYLTNNLDRFSTQLITKTSLLLYPQIIKNVCYLGFWDLFTYPPSSCLEIHCLDYFPHPYYPSLFAAANKTPIIINSLTPIPPRCADST